MATKKMSFKNILGKKLSRMKAKRGNNTREEGVPSRAGEINSKICRLLGSSKTMDDSGENSRMRHAFEKTSLNGSSIEANVNNSMPINVRVSTSARTHIGGMKRNEDDYFMWKHEGSNSVVIGVLDGHGSNGGDFAAKKTKTFMLRWVDERWIEMMENPSEAFRSMFIAAHKYLFSVFEEKLKAEGYDVKTFRGYLVKRKNPNEPWLSVHGGTTASIIAFCDGNRIITANVGDSSGVLLVKKTNIDPSDFVLQSSTIKSSIMEKEPSIPSSEESLVSTSMTKKHSVWHEYNSKIKPIGTKNGSLLLITADHSPESYSEFKRFRDTFPSPVDPSIPHALLIYDSPYPRYKHKCEPIFSISKDGTPFITGKGGYYKNVRHEWASLICTPVKDMHQNALAFTRSLGDFHLHKYGVISEPTVKEYSLNVLYEMEQMENFVVTCIVLCSDGIWDNWCYDEVIDYFLNDVAIESVQEDGSCDGIVENFLLDNVKRAVENFGDQVIQSYLTPHYSINY